MAEQESPFIEETPPVVEEPKPVDVDSLVGQLEKFGVTDPKKLEGKLRNAQDYSRVQSDRDRLANELAAMRAEITNMKSASQPKRESFESMVDEGRPIDVETLVANAAEKAVERVFRKNQEAAMKHQEWMNTTWKKISGNPRYHLVKGEFEEALRDPATVMEIQSGQRDPIEMFNDMLIGKYESLARDSVNAFKQLRGTSTVSAPHVESSARAPKMTKEQLTEQQKKINELREAAKKPGGLRDDQQEDLIQAALGDLLK